MSLPVEDVAALDDSTWNSILNRALAGRPHNPTMNRRIQHAIHDMRVQYTKEKEEQAELAELHNLINGGAHPGRQEVREAVAAANRKQTPVDMESINFIAVPYFMGEREGFEFKDGTDGLGYYKLLKKSTTKIWTRHRPDDACSPPGGSIATGPRKHRSGGFNPRSSRLPTSSSDCSKPDSHDSSTRSKA